MFRNVGTFISTRRREAGLTRSALARLVGVAAEEVRWWEETGRLPDAATLPKVAARLESTPDELLHRAGLFRGSEVSGQESEIRPEESSDVPPREGSERRRISRELPVFSTSLGELYDKDCMTVFPNIETRSVDCIFADPPFNLGKDYGGRVNDRLSDADYYEWSIRWLDEAIRVLKPGGSLFLYNLPKWNIHLGSYLDRFLEFKHWIAVDIKFSLPIRGRLYPSHYSLLYFVKGPRPRVFNPPRLPLQTCRHCGGEIKDYGGYKSKMNPEGVSLTDVWTDIPPVRHRRYKTRTANELSLKMLDRILDIATEEGDLVLDPFAGSGTTLVACEVRGRRWIGMEIGDCSPILGRFRALDEEAKQIEKIRSNINILFTPQALELRSRFGHDSSRYRLPIDERGDTETESGGE